MSLLSDLNEKIKRLSVRVADEFKSQQTAIASKVSTVNGVAPDENGNVEVAGGAAGLPLGFEYTRLVSDSSPKGGVDYYGQEGTRALYADLWEWVNTEHPGRVISEEDWQALYTAQNGNVPYYSTGDGSTTFRFPRAVGYLKFDSTAGTYIAEGLPNHDHTRGTMEIYGKTTYITSDAGDISNTNYPTLGAFKWLNEAYTSKTSLVSGAGSRDLEFLASRSWTGSTSPASEANDIYGNSSHVTPETLTVVMGVIAFGAVQSIGEATEEGILAEIESIKGNYVRKEGDTVTGSLISTVNHSLVLSLNAGNTYPAVAERTDTGNRVQFGIGEGGVNRGIWDIATQQWLINYDSNNYLSTGAPRLKFGNGAQIWVA